jgi:hypothetical protein
MFLVVAGNLTTVLAVAPLIAVLTVAAVIVCPASVHPEEQELELLQHRVLQADVVQLAHDPEGIPPTTPTLVQSIALFVSITSASAATARPKTRNIIRIYFIV